MHLVILRCITHLQTLLPHSALTARQASTCERCGGTVFNRNHAETWHNGQYPHRCDRRSCCDLGHSGFSHAPDQVISTRALALLPYPDILPYRYCKRNRNTVRTRLNFSRSRVVKDSGLLGCYISTVTQLLTFFLYKVFQKDLNDLNLVYFTY